jgi:hypothetical protein
LCLHVHLLFDMRTSLRCADTVAAKGIAVIALSICK